MDNVGYIYMITSPTDRVYIGSTKNINHRWNTYKRLACKCQPKLYRSLKKYGSENHKFEIIMKCDSNDRLKYEHLIGIYYEVLTKGMNCSLPGYDDIPQTMSEETKNKISKSNKGRKVSEKGRKNMSEAKLNRIVRKTTII